MIEKNWSEARIRDYVLALPIWVGTPALERMVGGLCNMNFKVTDRSGAYVARIGFDIPVHGIYQSSVGATMQAASALGVTPEVVHAEPSLLICRFAPGGALGPEDIGNPRTLNKVVALIKRLHEGSARLHGAVSYFWPFQVVRRYCELGREKRSRLIDRLPELEQVANLLERDVAPFTPVFTHNDLLPQNFVFDGKGGVLVVDWDYGGFGHPDFDLAAIAVNADASHECESRIVELYYRIRTKENWRRFSIFKVMVTLREYLWGMVQEVTSELSPELVAASMSHHYADQKAGYEGYTDLNEARFNRQWDAFRREFGV
jgi:thiamine kinase-like enzyme